jgi:diaminohydroxyphosphoribosylaminopyrimidine deaminase/5-amino-6-(5-phosphoribosylamino)uracil reductase
MATRELNIGFLSRMERGRPWVRMKIAASLDGTTALANGISQWITGEAARTDGHAWRRRASALLTGMGTVQEDDPRLDVRLVPTARQPIRVVVDSRLDISPQARLLQPPGDVWIVHAADPDWTASRRPWLDALGATLIACPGPAKVAGGSPKVDLPAMLQELARREVNELHVEAGHKLNGSFIREGLVDEFLVYLAPQLLGPGQGLANLPVLTELSGTVQLVFHAVDRIGPDLRLLLRKIAPSRG